MNTISQFKDDLWNGIFNNSKKLMLPTFLVGLIYMVILIAITITIFLSFFNLDTFKELSQNTSSNPFDLESVMTQSAYFEELITSIGPASFIAAFGLIYLFLFVILAWFTNIMLQLNQDLILTGESSVGDALKNSINADWLKLIMMYVLLLIFSFLLVVSSAALASVNVGLAFLGMMASWIMMNRFVATPGAIVHGKLSLPDAISFSLSNITFKRAAKAALVQFVVLILLFLAMLLISATAMIGAVGGVIGLLLQIALGILMYSLLFTSMSAAFFRYADVEVETDETVHLVEDL